MSQEEKSKNLLETALDGLESDVTLTEEEIAEKKDTQIEQAVYKVWGEDEDTQDAEEKEDEVEVSEDDAEATDSEEEEEAEEAYHSEEEDDDEEAEEAYHSEEEDDEEEVEEDEVVEPSDEEEPVKPEMPSEEEEEEIVDEVEDEDDEEEVEEMDMEDDEEEEDEEGMEEEEDEVKTSIDKISKTITAAATQKAMDKINATYNSMKEDVEALCAEDESLTEEFKSKAATIFEAAVSAKVRSQVEELAESYKETVKEEVSLMQEDLIGKIDTYMTYVAEQWVEKNEVAVTNSLRSEIAESFMSSLKTTFEDHYIEMPEGKTDMFDEISSQNAELQETVKEQEGANRKLTLQLVEAHRKAIVAEASEDLVDTQAAKFAELIKDVKFESTSKFKEKVATIKESYFSQKKVEKPAKSEKVQTNVKVVTEEIVENTPSLDPIMEKYLKAAGRLEVSHK